MAFSKYLDCELRLTDHDQARLSVGGRDYSGHPALDEARRHQLRKAALDPTQYGTLLFGALFPGDGDDLLTGYREGLAIARHDKRRLRFRLDIGPTAPPELHDLHWELLCDPKRKLALGRSRDTAFSRYLSVPLAPGTAVVERPKLLVVLAAPKDLAAYELPELDRDQMQQSIRKALSPLAGGVDCELLDAPATAERIRDRLVAGGFHIMHLQAHGLVDPERATANLVLEGDDHRATFIEEELVAEIMEGDRDLRLVTLIACHGGVHTAADPFSGLGPALVRRGIPAVVAMRRAISVAAAARFTEHLYLNLARSGQIDTAVNEARLQLHLAGPNLVEWGTPALFMRLREGLLWQAPAPDRDLRPGLVDHAELGYLTEPSQGAREIAEVLSRGEAVLVLGSALPVRAMEAERRTAEQVICGHLADQLTTPQAGRSLAVIARELEMESGREAMLEHLARAVRKPGNAPREIFRRLARLPFPVVVTTGYDAFLEEELTRAERTVHRLLNGWKIPEAIAEDGLVIRLFGGLEQMSSIVVTEDDQWQFFRSFHSLADRVKSWFATRSLIFVGCDPDEEGFRRLVSEIERFRVRRTRGWYLVTTEASLYAARWAESKGVRLIDAEPGPFLGLVEEALIELRREGGQTEAPPAPAKLPSRPYKFLNYFETEDAAIFFGRREETAKLASKIHAYPLNLLYAPSGCGKTSLIHAGLIPVLRQAGYCPLYTRVYDDPAGEIRRAVVAAGSEGGGAVAGEGPLEELLPRSASVLGRPLVVFVDQFEEIFIRYDREVRERFAATLRRCLDEGRGQVRFVLSLREDFLARLSEFRERLPAIFHNELRLAPLGEEESREAIVEPARLLDLEVESQLVDRLIKDLAAEGIDPPQLQIVCDTLYDALPPGKRRLTLKSYRSLGETRKILGGYLERVLRELPPEERQPTREILKALVTSEETKSLCRIADLARIAGCGEAEAARILAELANRRLIRRVPHEEGFWYELTHEYLVEEISRWLSERDRELKKIRELLEQAVRNYRHLGMLMTPVQARLVRANEDDLQLSKEERSLLRQSERAQRSRRRTAALAAVAGMILLLVVGVASRFWYLKTRIFLQSEDREVFSHSSLGYHNDYRFEGIRVFAGSPARWTLDRWLGFPQLEYHTDLDLYQIDAKYRDSIKVGQAYSRKTQPCEEILKMLRPDEKSAFLLTKGKNQAALQGLPEIYSSYSLEIQRVNSLTAFLGWSGIQDDSVINMAIEFALQQDRIHTSHYFMGSESYYRVLAAMLWDLPRERVQGYLHPVLGSHRSRKRALILLGLIGDRDDIATVAPYLGHDDPWTIRPAMLALGYLEDCTQLPDIRRIAFGSDALSPMLPLAVNVLGRCGRISDLDSLFEMMRHIENVDFEGDLRRGVLSAMSTILQRQKDSSQQHRFLDLPRELLNAPHAALRLESAEILADWGEPDGLKIAAKIALDEELESSRTQGSLLIFANFKSTEIQRFMVKALQYIPERSSLVHEIYRSLRWYDDDEVLSILVNGLGSGIPKIRNAAQRSLITLGSNKARERLQESSRSDVLVTRIYASRALSILEQKPSLQIFKNFLEIRAEAEKDLDLIEQAILGLQAAYRDKPMAVAIDALDHPLHEVRLAAITALLEHSDRQAVRHALEKRAKYQTCDLRTTAQTGLWALDLVQRVEDRLNSAEAALEHGDPQQAARIMNVIVGAGDRVEFPSALRGRLSPKFAKSKSGMKIFQLLAVRIAFLQAEIEMTLGRNGNAIWWLRSVVAFHPELRREIAEKPCFSPLRRFYSFNVEMGPEPPKTPEGLNLPEPRPAGPNDQLDPEPSVADPGTSVDSAS